MKITLTPDDMLKGLPFNNGWYKASISETVVKPSKGKDSINYIPTFKLDNDADNRSIDGNFNSKALGFIKPYLAALENLTLADFIEKHKKTGIEFDFEQTKGGKLQIKIENSLYENRQVSKVVDFAPYDYVVPF